MGVRAARARLSGRRCASSATAHGALLIFDEVITGFRVGLRRRAGAATASRPTSPASARSSAAGCRSAPTAAARDLMEQRRAARAASTRRARSPATRWRWPPAWRRCARSSAAAPTSGSRRWRRALADGLRGARRARRRAGHDQPRRLDAHRVLHRRPGRPTTPSREARGHRALRALLPRDAGARRLPAAVAVRGRLRLARPTATATSTAAARACRSAMEKASAA